MSRRYPISLGIFLLVPTFLSADPPARVARLNLTDGTVSFLPAGIDEWTNATVNRPLVNGDELWTEPSSRAELHVGSAALRLGASTLVAIVNQTDRIAQLRLTAGTLNIRLRHVGERDTWEVDTPNASVSLLKPGRYRVDVTSDGLTTIVIARGGEAEVTAGNAAFPVHADEQAAIAGTADQTHEISPAPPLDDFDRWSRDRDQREDRLAMTHGFPREVLGYEDLEASGTWRFAPEFGWVWTPTAVAVGWAPYRFGHWAWIEPWGWTWIDDAPWGFAPFHYGRWAFVSGAWLWVPGTIVRPVYAPALVAFGGGAGWRASISVGAVAWWPLAPGEVFVPAYTVAPVYVRNINAAVVSGQVNVASVNVTQVKYANQGVAGAMTAVPQASFASAKPVAASAIAVTPSQAASAAPIGTTAPVAPTAESVVGHSAAASTAVAHPPGSVASRAVVARTPAPPPPIPFAAKQHALAANPGHPLDHATEQKLRASGAAPSSNPLVQSSGASEKSAAAEPKEKSPGAEKAAAKSAKESKPKGRKQKPRKP